MQHTPGNTVRYLPRPAGSLKLGDVYKDAFEDAKPYIVTKIWHSAPGCPAHTHVNDSMCYDSGTDVWVKTS